MGAAILHFFVLSLSMPLNIDRNQYQNLTHLEFLARQVVEGFITGLHKSPFHGFSVEFAEHRLYNTGESTRHIDWKLYAKTEKLFTKRYEEETNLRCRILIDLSGSMRYPERRQEGAMNKLEFAMYTAAALTEMMRRQRDAVGISFFSDQVHFHSPAKSTRAHHTFLFQEMGKAMAQEGNEPGLTAAASALHEIAERIERRSLVVVLSDMFDNTAAKDRLFSALQHLKFNKHEVIVFHIADRRTELEFNFDNRPYTFVDTESGEEVKAHPNEVREAYLKEMGSFLEQLKIRCGQYGIDFVPSAIEEGFNQVLLRYLIKRNRLY